MRLIENITDEPHQEHVLLFDETAITLTLRFHPTVEIWCFDAEYKEWSVKGQKLSLGVLHMRSQNKPFDFVVLDTSGTGLDPHKVDDFSSGRVELYLLDADEMRTIRGGSVPL